MTTQTELWPPIEEPVYSPAQDIAERFNEFHLLNPGVYAAIVREARRVRNQDYRVGMKAIFEHLRWRWMEETQGDEYKLNNSYTAHYARLVMRQEPDLDGFFDTREAA